MVYTVPLRDFGLGLTLRFILFVRGKEVHAGQQTSWAKKEAAVTVLLLMNRRFLRSAGAGRTRLVSTFTAAVAAAAALFLLGSLSRCSAAEFTFGSVPGGEPRFSFNGFNPGGMGGFGGGGAKVDNEGYYKVGVRAVGAHVSPLA